MHLTKLLITTLFLAGCSVYQSNGRKALESSAYTRAGVAAFENLEGCGPSVLSSDWQKSGTSDGLTVWLRDLSNGETTISELQLEDSTGARSCLFSFTNDFERQDRLSSAVELTLLHLSLGQFAFAH